MRVEAAESRANAAELRLAQQTTGQAPAGPAFRPIKISDPDPFDGSRTALRMFKFALENKIAGNAHLFPSFAYEQSYIIGLLKGRAQSQIEARRRPDGSFPFSNRQELLAVLDQAFGDPDEAGTAQRKLSEMRQANRPFADYYADFQRYAPLSGWNPAALKFQLLRRISVELTALLHTVRTQTMTFEQLAEECQYIDSSVRAAAAATRATGRSSLPPSGRTPVTPAASAPPVSAPAPSSGGDPMDLSAVRSTIPRGPISDDEKARRRAENCCLYCGDQGHHLRHCPRKPQGSRLAASTVAPSESASAAPGPGN